MGLAVLATACSSVPEAGADTDTAVASTTVQAPTSTGPDSTTPDSTASTTPAPTTIVPAAVPPDQRPAPREPADLASQLSEAETMVRAPDLEPDEIAAWGRRQQQLYRLLPTDPAEAELVVAAVDERVRDAVRANWTARQNLSALVTSVELSPTLPAWRIREPLPADELLGYYREAESKTDIPWEVLAAIHLVETRMGRIEGLSTAGAVGPMQFLPSTWAECCDGDPTVDRDAIIGAAVYLTIRGGPDDMAKALRGYNNSDRYVEAVQAYARVLEADAAAYRGYHAWQVYFLSAAGLIVLPVGYEEPTPVDAEAWLAEQSSTVAD